MTFLARAEISYMLYEIKLKDILYYGTIKVLGTSICGEFISAHSPHSVIGSSPDISIFLTMKTLILISSILALGLADSCYEDNCARRVTGTWLGIGLPVESRISFCNDFVRATVSPIPT